MMKLYISFLFIVLAAVLSLVVGQHGSFGAGSYGNSAGFGRRGFHHNKGGYGGGYGGFAGGKYAALDEHNPLGGYHHAGGYHHHGATHFRQHSGSYHPIGKR